MRVTTGQLDSPPSEGALASPLSELEDICIPLGRDFPFCPRGVARGMCGLVSVLHPMPREKSLRPPTSIFN